jgi:hypothetical protein
MVSEKQEILHQLFHLFHIDVACGTQKLACHVVRQNNDKLKHCKCNLYGLLKPG